MGKCRLGGCWAAGRRNARAASDFLSAHAARPGKRNPSARSAPWTSTVQDSGELTGSELLMDLRQLRYFVRMVELGSLSRAAKALYVAQPALSQRLAQLEAEVAAQLLHRTARGVVPTEAGRRLYEHAQAILRQVEDAKSAATEANTDPAGRVAIGLPQSLAAEYALPLLQTLMQRHPRIKLQIFEELSGTIFERVVNGRLNLGVLLDEGQLGDLNVTPLLEERHFLVVAPRSALARRKKIALRQVAAQALVLPGNEHGVRVGFAAALARAGLALPELVAEVNSLNVMKRAVAARIAATILPWGAIADEVARGELVAVLIVDPSLVRTVAICSVRSSPQTRAAQCVQAALLDTVRTRVGSRRPRGVRLLLP